MQIEGHTFNSSLLTPSSIVIDIGANHGNFSKEILEQFNCKVVSYEPDKPAFDYLKNITSNNFTVINKAVSGKAGTANFYSVQPMSGGNSIIPGIIGLEQSSVYDVEVESFDNIMQEYLEVDLVKMDCEGAEFSIIKESNPENFKKIKQITIEFHDFCFEKFTDNDVNECVEILRGIGFISSGINGDYYFYNQSKERQLQ